MEAEVNIIESVWFTLKTGPGIIGIVKIDDGYNVKWYMGTASGLDEKQDEQQIAKFGTPVYPSMLKQFFDI
jgi:hypothetical protein